MVELSRVLREEDLTPEELRIVHQNRSSEPLPVTLPDEYQVETDEELEWRMYLEDEWLRAVRNQRKTRKLQDAEALNFTESPAVDTTEDKTFLTPPEDDPNFSGYVLPMPPAVLGANCPLQPRRRNE